MNDIKLEQIKEFAMRHEGRILGRYGRASVLVPLIHNEGPLEILFEVRSKNLNTQPGEISFPGGKMEEGEVPRSTAIRETSEELGIDMDCINVLCELNRIRTYSNFTMYSFLGVISQKIIDNAQINEDEVEEIFTVPLDFFLNTKPYVYECDVIPDIKEDFPYDRINFSEGYNWRKGKTIIPIYEYEGYVIWGLTARIMMNLAEEINEFICQD